MTNLREQTDKTRHTYNSLQRLMNRRMVTVEEGIGDADDALALTGENSGRHCVKGKEKSGKAH